MQIEVNALLAEAWATVQDPRAGAQRILAMDLPLGTAALALVIVALLTGLISALVSLMMVQSGASDMPMANLSPLQWVGLQTIGLFIGAATMAYVGQWFGGYGTLRQAIALLAWAEFIILLVQLAQVVTLFLLPPMSLLLALLGAGLTLYLIAHFTAQMHGFPSVIKVFFGMIGTVIALIMGLAIVVTLLFGPMGV